MLRKLLLQQLLVTRQRLHVEAVCLCDHWKHRNNPLQLDHDALVQFLQRPRVRGEQVETDVHAGVCPVSRAPLPESFQAGFDHLHLGVPGVVIVDARGKAWSVDDVVARLDDDAAVILFEPVAVAPHLLRAVPAGQSHHGFPCLGIIVVDVQRCLELRHLKKACNQSTFAEAAFTNDHDPEGPSSLGHVVEHVFHGGGQEGVANGHC
mmetsp:Transcript_64128/g.200773  ORF Transcript_64128/g.200773 Transcript_64128/m.200773 type:complete len:207 (+) Transcript_64128:279-899(+)